MKKFLANYVSEFEKELNTDLMDKAHDAPLVDYIIDCWKSLEILNTIKCVSFEYTEMESKLDINDFIFKREKGLKKKDRFDYKFISDNRCGRLIVKLEITLPEKDPKTGEISIHKHHLTKSMLIPLQDDDGYFYLNGSKKYLIYQLVEKSTYTTSQTITLKSLMPIAVKRRTIDVAEVNQRSITTEKLKKNGVDVYEDGKEYTLPVYNVYVFKKEVPIILFYLSKGSAWTLDFLGVSGIMRFVERIDDTPVDENGELENIYFQISSKCFLECNRKIFDESIYVQSIVGGFMQVCTNRVTVEQLEEDRELWIKKVSNPPNLEKGYSILKSLNRMLDETTKKILKIHPYHKKDIYTLLRWMMQEFTVLRLKDNMNLENKRLRCNEYIASLLTLHFSSKLQGIISQGENATISKYKDMFNFPGNMLIQKMENAGILRFDDDVNDMNFFSKFKFTVKGPHSQGGKNSNNISMKTRGLHPSYLGYFDVLVCGNSDPGLSGVISPFTKMEGLYFDNSDEPDDYAFELKKKIEEVWDKKGVSYIKLNFDNADDYYDAMVALDKCVDEKVRIMGTSRKGQYDIIIEEEKDEDNIDNE